MKTCGNCPAFAYGDFKGKCNLGYDIKCYDMLKTVFGDINRFCPVEGCEKPKTVKQYVEMTIERSKKLEANDWRA